MSNEPRRDALNKSISETERKLLEVEAQVAAFRRLLESQKEELAGLMEVREVEEDYSATDIPPQTTADKVTLFRELFRGRPDVYPRFWSNPRSGKHGYAPACANEWVRSVCQKPRIKCGECPNQAFLPVGDRVILDHLIGKHAVGVYPLLQDETCWFLAVDLDRSSWVDDVAAVRQTCGSLGVPVAVERSRSGNGAHIWIFFDAPVSAGVARQMGCHILTETMARRPELNMESYDRLFPNQDTMPRGGFGNLIALPFQYGHRQAGNTVFLDEQMTPYADQWTFLASVRRMASLEVERIAHEAQRRGLVIGVRPAELDSDAEDRAPSHHSTRPPIRQPVPPAIRAVLAQRLFVEKDGLPAPLLNQIMRVAAFQNPEFYKKQNFRLSTALTPRVISCAEDLGNHIALPRGCLADLDDLLRGYGATLSVEDKRTDGASLGFSFQGTLTEVQRKAAQSLLAHEFGVLSAPPGVGKTVVAISMIAQRARSTLVLVHRRPLLEQWVAQLSIFLGVAPGDIGTIGAGRNAPNGTLDVAMLQSLMRGDRVADLVENYGHVVVDECHHIPAISFERVMRELKARFLTGLTATPQRRDGHHPILAMQLGPLRHVIDPRSHEAASQFSRRLVVRETDFQMARLPSLPPIQDIYRNLTRDERRNSQIIDDIIGAIEEGRSPIVLTERKDHLDLLAGELSKAVKNVVVLQGGMNEKARRKAVATLAETPRDEDRVVLATGRFAGEGFDDPRLDTLFLALPVSWKGTLIQYAGRLHRHLPDKTDVRIYDYVDGRVPILRRMFEKRLRGYRAMGYEPEPLFSAPV